MKKAFLLLILSFTFLSVNSQNKINVDDLIGYWEPDVHSTQLVFWKNVKNELQVVEFSTNSGTMLDMISFNVGKTVIIETKFEETNWITKSEFTFVDKNTLRCLVSGDGSGEIIYTRIK